MVPEPVTTPLKQRSSVVFPAPLTPSTANICPGSIVNVTLSSALTPPYRFEMRGKLPEDVVITVAVWPYKKVYPMAMMPRADAGTGYPS